MPAPPSKRTILKPEHVISSRTVEERGWKRERVSRGVSRTASTLSQSVFLKTALG
uniref:Uncharacterized protein n=1 Tax=Anguilla anguilla TaxID=7936 RepID=A0A0E9QU93_ANGAN